VGREKQNAFFNTFEWQENVGDSKKTVHFGAMNGIAKSPSERIHRNT